MTTAFAYRAVHPSGRIHKGTLAAESEGALVFALGRRNLELIDARPVRSSSLPFKRRKKSSFDSLAFAAQMSDLLRAGVPFAQALALMIDVGGTGNDVLTALERDVRAGSGVAKALAAQNGAIDSVGLSLLEAGERTGDLTGTFARLRDYLTAQKTLRETIRRAIRYPLFLLAVAASATGFMMLWVVPQITGFLVGQMPVLPLSTRWLLAAAELFAALWWVLPCAAIVLWMGLVLARVSCEHSARLADALVLRVPFFGAFRRRMALARFMSSLALLARSGTALPSAIEVAARALGNRHLRAEALRVRESVLSGHSFAQAAEGLLPPMTVRALRIGESSGALIGVLDELAQVNERQARQELESFLGALEPGLTVLVGCLMAWVVLAVLGPLYGSLGAISGGL